MLVVEINMVIVVVLEIVFVERDLTESGSLFARRLLYMRASSTHMRRMSSS